MDYTDTTIIIPTINEEKNIGKLLGMINRLYKGARVIVADDGSTDRTREIAKANGARVLDRRKEKKGLAASVISAAGLVKTSYFIVIDGDLQHPPEKIRNLVELLRKGYKVAVASRKRVDSRWPLLRRVESRTAMMLGRLKLMGKPFSRFDLMSGFFGCDTRFFLETYRKSPQRFVPEGFKILFDLLKCLPKDEKVGQVWYVFGARSEGESKIGKKHVYFYLKSLVR